MPSTYQRGKEAGERAVQLELWDVEYDWKEDRRALMAERNEALGERDDWRGRAESLLAKLSEQKEAVA